MSGKSKDLMLGLLIVGGAYVYMQSQKAKQQYSNMPQQGQQLGQGTMPASAGIGQNNALGGILGSLATWAGQKLGIVNTANPNPQPRDWNYRDPPSFDYLKVPSLLMNNEVSNIATPDLATPTYFYNDALTFGRYGA